MRAYRTTPTEGQLATWEEIQRWRAFMDQIAPWLAELDPYFKRPARCVLGPFPELETTGGEENENAETCNRLDAE